MMRIDHREKDLENHDRGLDYDLPRCCTDGACSSWLLAPGSPEPA
jgi:hypothetical protein